MRLTLTDNLEEALAIRKRIEDSIEKEMNMKHIKATYEDFEVEFHIGSRENHSIVNITQLAYEMLKEEGADCLLSEVEWISL